MAFVAFDIPPANAPKAAAVAATPVMARQDSRAHRPAAAIIARAAIAVAALVILSIIAWNVTVETGSILIGLGAADILFLIAVSLGLSMRGASRSARGR